MGRMAQGWGLYLSMGLARRMGGGLCAQNVPGAGAAFTLSFPIQVANPAAMLASEAGPYRVQELARHVAVEFSALACTGKRAGLALRRHTTKHF